MQSMSGTTKRSRSILAITSLCVLIVGAVFAIDTDCGTPECPVWSVGEEITFGAPGVITGPAGEESIHVDQCCSTPVMSPGRFASEVFHLVLPPYSDKDTKESYVYQKPNCTKHYTTATVDDTVYVEWRWEKQINYKIPGTYILIAKFRNPSHSYGEGECHENYDDPAKELKIPIVVDPVPDYCDPPPATDSPSGTFTAASHTEVGGCDIDTTSTITWEKFWLAKDFPAIGACGGGISQSAPMRVSVGVTGNFEIGLEQLVKGVGVPVQEEETASFSIPCPGEPGFYRKAKLYQLMFSITEVFEKKTTYTGKDGNGNTVVAVEAKTTKNSGQMASNLFVTRCCKTVRNVIP